MTLKSIPLPTFNWYDVLKAYAEHTGMSFHSEGCWGLDYSKLAGEPDFSGHRILQHEQDYAYIETGRVKEFCVKTLEEVLAKSEKGTYRGKTFYKIPYYLVIEYLITNDILPEDQFLVTTDGIFF